MAKRTLEIKKIADSFQSWLEDNHYLDRTIGFKISENWQAIAGNTIFNHTKRIDVHLPKIYLKIDNSSLREMLFMDKQLLIDKINDFVKQEVIKEIIFT
jgi:hypothetical protein